MSMELRMLLAIVLSFLMFLLYQVLFVKEVPVPEKDLTSQSEAVKEEAPVEAEAVKVLDEEPLVEQQDVQEEGRPGRIITVSTPLYVAEVAERGGGFKSFKLKKYKESLAPDAPMRDMVRLAGKQDCTPQMSFHGKGVAGLGEALFTAGMDSDLLDVSDQEKALSLTWTSSDGLSIVKTYSFSPESYEMGLEIKVRNLSSSPIEENLILSLREIKDNGGSRYVFSGPAALINGELEEIETKKIEKKDSYTGRIGWVAIEDQYFASAIIPEKVEEASIKLSLGTKGLLDTAYVDPSGPVSVKTERTYKYGLYFGPKSLKDLGSTGSALRRILDFGFFDIIAKPLLHAMNFVYRFIPNYGIAIILMTILVKILFWPLSNKSYKSMSQMKRLQPKMAEIRAKYKNDKKMMNQELMNLYKVYKVNPLGGCLPMVMQIPVFFAFYKMLYQAIELRHAPFFLWVTDLAAPDRLFDLGFKVPMMEPPYGIPVLTLIMGASMFIQQKMTPPPGDPTQAKMMMFMPIFFTFIFINFPSGLVLYWLVNNVLSMAQQYYINKKMA
ncbi:MAG: membrane protein insertase YidC [Thermodesulfobacteriota bacterium]|nr:membrane protein insertase YidC [Thermodesulfobacteriota bacterium]